MALHCLAVSTRGRRLVDLVGLCVVELVLLDVLRPALLLLPTIAAGGDTPCHFPTAAWLHERLLPAGRLHGWYPGAYLGHPLLLYYFPLPFLLMSALALLVGLPAAFKLGTALGVFLLPLLVYAAFRILRLPFPAPLLGAAAALVFLFVEENPIWGGTLASTLAGEFSYTYAIGLAVVCLAVTYRASERGSGPWGPAALLALVAFAHGYAVLWAGLTASFLLVVAARPWRALRWLGAVAALSFALAAPLLVPLLADWGWTTPYDDAWITVKTEGLLPPLLRPLHVAGVLGLAAALLRFGDLDRDRRLLLFGHGTLAGAALAAAGPALGVIDVRFVPFAQLSLALAGAAALGLVLSRLVRADLAAIGLVLLAAVHAEGSSRVARSWVDWNYSGLEAKELWSAWRGLCDHLRGGVDEPRVAVEYGAVHERAGSIRMYETLPFFSGRSTLEGVYNQASVMTHPVYYVASELFAVSPNPFRSRTYARFDPASALTRLRVLNVSHVVAVSAELREALDARDDVVREADIPPYTVYRLRDPGPGYAEALAFAPVRAPREGWRDAAYRWMSRQPPNRAHLVFTDDTRFGDVQEDTWAPPGETPLAGGASVRARLGGEEIRITTTRPGHPVLVKVSYHPRWRAVGGDGPYLVSPGLMLVVPRGREMALRYAARTGADALGGALLAMALAGGLVAWWRRRRSSRSRAGGAAETPGASTGASGALPHPDASDSVAGDPFGRPADASSGSPAGGGFLGGRAERALRAMPFAILVVLSAARLLPEPPPPVSADELDERASRAFAHGRWEHAAEYARHAALLFGAHEPRRAEMACVRGEALLRAGHPREAAASFARVLDESPDDPHRAQALYSGAVAREAAGDPAGAREWRRRLVEEWPESAWTERLESESRADAGP